MKNKLGFIGYGVINRSFSRAFMLCSDIKIWDPYQPDVCANSLEEVVEHAEFLIVGVPTPMKKAGGGPNDTSIVESVVREINEIIAKYNYENKIVILRSTIKPGTSDSLAGKYKNVNIVFNPEFLTERAAYLDFMTATRVVIGGNEEHVLKVQNLYKQVLPHVKYFLTDRKTAEMGKYGINCFFAMKVAFCNELYKICTKLGIEYNTIRDIIASDGRVTPSHMSVPGTDGDFGFGGKCLPKDINALIYLAKELGLDPKILSAAWETNIEMRKNWDWKEIKGATSENLHSS